MSELIFIGTGSALESLDRFHSSFLIKSKNYNLLIDAGDGVSKALLNQQINYFSIDGILFTHFHPDHFSGFGGLIVQMEILQREEPLEIFAHSKLIPFIKDYLNLSYLYEKRLKFKINFVGYEHEEDFNICDNLKVISKNNTHIDIYKKYGAEFKNYFSSSSFILTTENKKIFYTGDIGSGNDLYIFSDEKINYMITEITHVSAVDIIEAVKTIKPEKLYLTHISDADTQKINSIIKENSKFYISTIEAKDGLKFKI